MNYQDNGKTTTAFAYYRLPCERHAIFVAQHAGEPETLSTVAQLDGKEGFVIAPFQPSADCPVVLIRPDEKRVVRVPEKVVDAGARGGTSKSAQDSGEAMRATGCESPCSDGYARDFECFHEQLQRGVFRKIVLARRSVGETRLSAEELFAETCRMYPRLFVALVCSEASGMWLMATPEVLLQGGAGRYATMSLAGTRKAAAAIPSERSDGKGVEQGTEWRRKDREEQQYVTDYIEACVKTFSDDYRLQGPYTVAAAHLYHLRTDISFALRRTDALGTVLDALYPTPAVCGIPKDLARNFILRHERSPRLYYSGFVGMLSPHADTHLFVSLRCMRLLPRGVCELYAGGGLLRESEMEKEWKETEAKMQTMRKVMVPNT